MSPSTVFTSREFPDVDELAKLVANYERIPNAPEKTLEYDPLEQLKKYKARLMKGSVRVNYIHSARAKVFGRMFAKDLVGLQQMARPLRHTLAHKRYKDIDVENAHPVLLAQYCVLHNIVCPELNNYIKNRNELLVGLGVPRDQAKQAVLSLLNGGAKDYNNLKTKPEWLVDFKAEVHGIQEAIKDKNPILYQACRKWNKEKPVPSTNHLGSCMNHILCDLENKVLHVCFQFLTLKSIDIAGVVPTFDGFMVLKTEKPFSCKDLGDYVKEQIGYPVTFVEKPMNDVLDLSDFDVPIEDIAVDDDTEGANIFIARNGSVVKRCGKRVFVFSNNIWNEDYEIPLRALILNSRLLKRNAKGETRPYAGNTSGANALMTAILALLPNEPKFVENLWFNNLGKVFYQDGYYDFDDGHFYETVDPSHSHTTTRIPFDFPKYSADAEQLVLDTILMPIFGEGDVILNYLELMARGLAGRIEDKSWMANRGFRNSGKGVLTDALKAAFCSLVETFNADSLMTNPNSATQDIAKSLSAFKKFEWVRLGISNEIVFDGRSINGNIIKGKLASGGDGFEVRQNYKDEISIIPQTFFCFNLNDCPKFSPPDCLSTLSQFVLSAEFCETPVEGTNMKLADPDLKRKLRTPEYIAGLTHLLLKAYKRTKPKQCEQVEEWTQSLMENNGKEDNIVKEAFIITSLEKDWIPMTKLRRWLETSQTKMSMDKLGDHLVRMGAKFDKHLGGTEFVRGNVRGYKCVKEPEIFVEK